MLRAIAKILSFFGIYLLIFIISKPVFMFIHVDMMGDINIGDWFEVILHGIPMDCSMAGYLTVIPALLTMASLWSASRTITTIQNIYIALTAIIISIVFVLDAVLYGYWNFRLDTTPFFYFFSSPASAMASASTLTIAVGIIVCTIIALSVYLIIVKTAAAITVEKSRNASCTIVCLILTAALFIPIRGSLTVSTMNLSRSYFSSNQRLNHAAINPLFSLLYSAMHQSDFASQFRFFSDNECRSIFDRLSPQKNTTCDSITTLTTTERPDIYIIILESFSAHLMTSLEGEDIASGLDSIARNGLLFSNFYASGIRTDRALPAILSAFPAQPNTSLMKYAKKIERTPSLPKALKDSAGYEMSYYYGGDANFTNMLAYLISSGFDTIISDKDFSVKERTGKWGAHDHILFDRTWNDIKKDVSSTPKLRVIQTSSSHEPFEVPYSDPRYSDIPRKNAFAYTDHSLKMFIDSLAVSPAWNKSLIIITPDHYGVYPEHIDNPIERHHVPLIITGGALSLKPGIIPAYGDQTDIAATILSALGIDHSDFIYSHNLLDTTSHHYAFFSEPGIAGYVSDNGTYVLNLDNNRELISDGMQPEQAAQNCKAILQTIYNNLSNL